MQFRRGLTPHALGRGAAEAIFFRTLIYKLSPGSSFRDSRLGSLSAASELYGYGSAQYNAVKTTWDAVGVAVGEEPPPPPPPPSCDINQEQYCYDTGGWWDPGSCSCYY